MEETLEKEKYKKRKVSIYLPNVIMLKSQGKWEYGARVMGVCMQILSEESIFFFPQY